METTKIDEIIIRLEFETLDEGGYIATSPDIQGLVAQGRTISETVEIARDVARKIAESCLAHGDPLPEVFTRKKASEPVAFDIPVAVP